MRPRQTGGTVQVDSPQEFLQGEVTGSWFTRAKREDRLFVNYGVGSSFGDQPLFNDFSLGGPLRLSAFNGDELRASNYLLGGVGYLKKVGRLADVLGGNIYLGGWFEMGSAHTDWDDMDYRNSVSLAGVHGDTARTRSTSARRSTSTDACGSTSGSGRCSDNAGHVDEVAFAKASTPKASDMSHALSRLSLLFALLVSPALAQAQATEVAGAATAVDADARQHGRRRAAGRSCRGRSATATRSRGCEALPVGCRPRLQALVHARHARTFDRRHLGGDARAAR